MLHQKYSLQKTENFLTEQGQSIILSYFLYLQNFHCMKFKSIYTVYFDLLLVSFSDPGGGRKLMREKGRNFLFFFSLFLFFLLLSGVGVWDLWQVQFFLKSFHPIKINQIY